MNGQMAWGDIPVGLQVALIVLAVLQLCVQVVALVNLLRTPEERLQTGKRWVWLLIVLVGGLVGAVVYLATGKCPPQAHDPSLSKHDASSVGDRGRRAADLLYGKPSDSEESNKDESCP